MVVGLNKYFTETLNKSRFSGNFIVGKDSKAGSYGTDSVLHLEIVVLVSMNTEIN